MPDPVSWFMIESGWTVVDRDGDEVGKVAEVTGDENADIFDGLSIASGLFGRARYVPAEQVAEITEGRIRLDLSRAEVERLAEYEEPAASLEVSSEKAGVADRVAAPFVDEGETPPPSSWSRLRDRLFRR
jgi:hypothetical protein